MSYCRWSECDVYAYDSCEGGVRFWVAGNDSLNRLCGTYNEAYQYAKKLRDKHGLDVPDHAIDELREDAIDEAKQYLGPESAVADMLDENAKLRDELEMVGTAAYMYGRDDLKADNAKLRELASTMWPYILEAYYSGEMQYEDYATIRDSMQELGIGGGK